MVWCGRGGWNGVGWSKVVKRFLPVEWTPVESWAGRVIRFGAVTPVAVFDGVVFPRLLHQSCIERLVPLPAATVYLDAIKVKIMERANIALVVDVVFSAFAALASVQVPTRIQAQTMDALGTEANWGEAKRRPERGQVQGLWPGPEPEARAELGAAGGAGCGCKCGW